MKRVSASISSDDVMVSHTSWEYHTEKPSLHSSFGGPFKIKSSGYISLVQFAGTNTRAKPLVSNSLRTSGVFCAA